jgi:hypothetical protein
MEVTMEDLKEFVEAMLIKAMGNGAALGIEFRKLEERMDKLEAYLDTFKNKRMYEFDEFLDHYLKRLGNDVQEIEEWRKDTKKESEVTENDQTK